MPDPDQQTNEVGPFVSGAEFLNFYQNHWPSRDWYLEECEYGPEDEEGVMLVQDTDRLDLEKCGWMGWQGRGDPPRKHTTFREAFLSWKEGSPASEFLLVTVPQERKAEITSLLQSLGLGVRAANVR